VFVFVWRKNIGEKSAHEILVKLAASVNLPTFYWQLFVQK